MVFGDLVTFSCIIDVSPHYFPRSTTVSSLIDEHVAALFLRRPGKAGTEGHQEGKERDLDEHVFGVDSANPLWFAMGNSRLEWTGRTTRGRGSAWRRLFEHNNRRLRVRGAKVGAGCRRLEPKARTQEVGGMRVGCCRGSTCASQTMSSAPGARWAGLGLPLPFGAETPLPLPPAAATGAGHGWMVLGPRGPVSRLGPLRVDGGRGVPWVVGWLG